MELYMQLYSSDFTKAQYLVKKDVSEMKSKLDENFVLQFGSVALFTKEGDRLIFSPTKQSEELFSTQSYGLPVFNFLPLSAHDTINMHFFETTMSKQPSDTETVTDNMVNLKKNVTHHTIIKNTNSPKLIYTIPVYRAFLQIIATTAAAILLFFLLTPPVGDVNKESYNAGFILPDIVSIKTVDKFMTEAQTLSETNSPTVLGQNGTDTAQETQTPTSQGGTNSEQDAQITMLNVADSSPKTSDGSCALEPAASTKTPAATTASSAGTGGIKYYVIIGSSKSQAQAQKFVNQHKAIFADVGIVFGDGNYRVFSQFFSSEKDARTHKTKIRQNNKFSQAWVYKVP